MTDKEILHKVYDKAVANGYSDKGFGHNSIETFNAKYLYGHIFSHDFARALWGYGIFKRKGSSEVLQPWQYHLQEMVLADNPIKYLSDNI